MLFFSFLFINTVDFAIAAVAASGAFPVGSEWVGVFSDNNRGVVVAGQLTMQVLVLLYAQAAR
jgi:hypothetical protein